LFFLVTWGSIVACLNQDFRGAMTDGKILFWLLISIIFMATMVGIFVVSIIALKAAGVF
jgi:hypothetical protein